jgi:DNA repair exonuclease SbcCD nuclease subunit
VTVQDKPSNLYVFSEAHSWQSYALADNVTVTGLDTKNLRESCYGELSLDKNTFNVVMMHGEVMAAKTEKKEQISLQRLQHKHIDYLALGHIHKHTYTAEKLDSRGVWRYCGCMEGRGFDECGRRGAFELEIQNGQLTSQRFLSFAKRMFTEVEVDISACRSYYDVEQTALAALANEPRENAVKIVLCGRHVADLKKEVALLQQRFCEWFFFARVEDCSRIFVDPKQFENDLTARGEFVREVGRYEMNEEMRLEILEIGLKALAGEEIDL